MGVEARRVSRESGGRQVPGRDTAKGQGMLYAFGDFELDPQRYELRQAGAPCALDPQSFNVLLYLVQHRDRVVSKDELLEQLWPNQSVSESTLTQRLRTVRHALGDSGREQHTIKTTHGRGYRFIAAVAERSREEAAADTGGEGGTRACPACQQVHTGDARLCHTCGASLRRSCPACGQENAPQAHFCHACGVSLQTATPAPVETPSDIRETPACIEETAPPADAHAWLQGRCSPYHQQTPLYAVVELIQGALQWHETDTSEVKRLKLEQAVRQAYLPVEETVRRVAELVSFPLPGSPVVMHPLDPESERQQLFAALLALAACS